MRVEKATIKLVLRTNKLLSDGTHPIMVRVNWGGKRAEKSTGYSCKKTKWNEKTSLLKEGKGSIDNASQINVVLSQIIKRAESIRNEFILKGKPYSAAEIIGKLDEETPVNKPSVELHEFKIVYQEKKHLRIETMNSINTTVNYFTAFMNKKTISLSEVTKTDVESFGRWLKNRGYKTNTVIVTLRNLSALFSFAVECGFIDESPFKHFKISSKYRQESHKQPISRESLELFKMFYKEQIGGMGITNYLKQSMRISSKIFAMNVFLISYTLQGLALVDMAKLTDKEAQQIVSSTDGELYLIIATHRSKTGKEVVIVVKTDEFTGALLNPYIEHSMRDNGYFLPIIRKKDDTERKVLVRIRYATEWVNRNLHGHKGFGGYKAYDGIWKEFNNWLISSVNEGKLQVDYVNKDNVRSFLIQENTTFYAARHTFASNFINSEGATASELAALLGRNVSGIDRYIRELKTVQDIIKAREKMK